MPQCLSDENYLSGEKNFYICRHSHSITKHYAETNKPVQTLHQ